MTDGLSFGQRITAPWRNLARIFSNLQKQRLIRQIRTERNAHRRAFLAIGRRALATGERNILTREGAMALISACIHIGINNRRGVIETVPQLHPCSDQEVAAWLDDGAGPRPQADIWSIEGHGDYFLLPFTD